MPHINQYTILNIYTRARRICLLIRWFIAMVNLPAYGRHHVKTIFILCFKLSFLKCADRFLTLLLDFLLSFFCYIPIAPLFPFGFYFNFLSFTFPSLFSSFFRLFITFPVFLHSKYFQSLNVFFLFFFFSHLFFYSHLFFLFKNFLCSFLCFFL